MVSFARVQSHDIYTVKSEPIWEIVYHLDIIRARQDPKIISSSRIFESNLWNLWKDRLFVGTLLQEMK